jgi:hypothetical protein
MRLGHASASTAFDTEQEQASFAVPRMRVLGVCRTAQPQPCIEIRMYAATKLAHIAMCAKVRQHATFASFRLDSTSTPSPPLAGSRALARFRAAAPASERGNLPAPSSLPSGANNSCGSPGLTSALLAGLAKLDCLRVVSIRPKTHVASDVVYACAACGEANTHVVIAMQCMWRREMRKLATSVGRRGFPVEWMRRVGRSWAG